MNDKSLILAEARRKAEEELKALRTKTSRYTLLAIGFGLAIAVPISMLGTMLKFPFNLFPYVFLVIGYAGIKQYARVQILLPAEFTKQSIENEPQDASDYSERAGTLYAYGFYEAAVEDYRSALEMEPDSDQDWLDLAESLWELGQKDEAQSIVEKMSAAEGDYQGLALVLQGKFLAEEDPAAALKCFDKGIEIEPDYSYHRLSRIRFFLGRDRLGETAEAIEETTKVLKKQRHYQYHCAEIYEFRGTLALKQGRFTDAVRDFGWAIWNRSSEAEYHRLRGDAHEALGNLAKADADRKKAEILAGKRKHRF